jgi:hypothetical protein
VKQRDLSASFLLQHIVITSDRNITETSLTISFIAETHCANGWVVRNINALLVQDECDKRRTEQSVKEFRVSFTLSRGLTKQTKTEYQIEQQSESAGATTKNNPNSTVY